MERNSILSFNLHAQLVRQALPRYVEKNTYLQFMNQMECLLRNSKTALFTRARNFLTVFIPLIGN
jgi:hypothetical protein